MNNIELAERISAYLKGSKAKAKKFQDLVAVNFTLIGCDDDLYIAVRDGVLDVNHYHYDDYQANVSGSAESIDSIFAGELDMDKAIADGLVKVEGDEAKFKALAALIPSKKATEKAPAKKDAVKAPAKKAETKASAKKEEAKAEVKADTKTEVKAEVKPEVKAAAPAKKKCCGKKSKK